MGPLNFADPCVQETLTQVNALLCTVLECPLCDTLYPALDV